MNARPVAFVCAWCERVRTADGTWREWEEVGPAPAEATHGICPRCLAEQTRAATTCLEAR